MKVYNGSGGDGDDELVDIDLDADDAAVVTTTRSDTLSKSLQVEDPLQ